MPAPSNPSKSSSQGPPKGPNTIQFNQQLPPQLRTLAPIAIHPEVVTPPANDKLALITALTDPAVIEFHCRSVATQLVKGAKANGFQGTNNTPIDQWDITPMIADIIIETTVQGASTLEVHCVDPYWLLMLPNDDGISFISTSEDGWLLPIDVNFPFGATDSWWRLCAAEPSLMNPNSSDANVILTFESIASSKMRQIMGGTAAAVSQPGTLISQFIQNLVDQANRNDPKSASYAQIHFISQIEYSTWDLQYADQAASSKQKNASPSRKNPQKNVGGGVGQIGKEISDKGSLDQAILWAGFTPSGRL